MGTFESLEDSFNEKASQPVNTDFEEMQKRKLAMTEAQNAGKETYEDKLRKKNIVSGLAAMFEARLKNVSQDNEASDDDTNGTVTFTTNTLRYEDQITLPQNEVSEEDIQRFYPHEKYNDVHIEPTNTIKDDTRHDTENKYGDTLSQFEPRVASENDITEGRSISSLTTPGEPSMNPSADEVMRHIDTHRQKKSERVISEAGDITSTKSDPKETILDEESYLNVGNTRPPFKVQQDAVENQQEQESSEEDSSETE
jgi:hypothetical protein